MQQVRIPILWVCALSAAYTGCSSTTPGIFDPPETGILFRDDFDGRELVSGWNFKGADETRKSLDQRPGFLRLLAQDLAQVASDSDNSLLLRSVQGDFVLTTLLEFDPLADRHIAGLAIEGDDGQILSFGLLTASGTRGSFRGVLPIAGDSAKLDLDRTALLFDGTAIYLRIQRVGDRFALAHSADGVAYQAVGTVVLNLSDEVRVGLGTAQSEKCNSACEEIAPADFDFFEIAKVTEGVHAE